MADARLLMRDGRVVENTLPHASAGTGAVGRQRGDPSTPLGTGREDPLVLSGEPGS